MQLLVNYTLEIGAALAFLSAAMMGRYLVHTGVSTWWQLRTTLLWPEILFKYRDHTRKHHGRTGRWYPLFSGAITLVGLGGTLELGFITASALLPVLIAVWFTYVLIVPLLGLAIYNLSKATYF